MTDSINSQIDALVVASQPSALRISSDRTNGETAITSLPTAASTIANSSGDVSPVTSFTTENAVEQHTLIQSKLDAVNALLNEQTYDTKGVASLKVTGHERGLLELQKVQFGYELQFLARHAADVLPRVGAANDAQQSGLEAAAKRAQSINVLAETAGADGRPIGRVAAAKIIDEAGKRQLADRLVRGR